MDHSFAAEDTGICIEKHYYVSHLSKGPCDAENGVVTRIAGLAVNHRQVVIASAEDLYRFG